MVVVAIMQKRLRATVTSKKQVTLPSELYRHLGLRQGDRLIFMLEPDGTARVMPERNLPDYREFVGAWREAGLPADGNRYVEELRGPAEPEA